MRLSLAAVLFAVSLAAQAQPDPASLHVAVEDFGRRAAADFIATEGAASYQRLAVIPRDGDASEAVAQALAEALRDSGRTVADAESTRTACSQFRVPWAAPDPLGQREQAEIMGAVDAQGLILVRAASRSADEGMVAVSGEMTLTDPGQIGWPWSLELEVEAQAGGRRAGDPYWKRHPEHVIGLIAVFVVLWVISAVRRRQQA